MVNEPIRLRGHHLTAMWHKLDDQTSKIYLEVYGKEHTEHGDNLEKQLLENENLEIEIVKGFDDICEQCKFLKKCKISYTIVQSEFENAYREITKDKDSYFSHIDLELTDFIELKKIDKFFHQKHFLRNLATKIGLRKKNTYKFHELREKYKTNSKKLHYKKYLY